MLIFVHCVLPCVSSGYHAIIPVSSVAAHILLLSEAVTLRQLQSCPEQPTWRPSEAAQMGGEGFRAFICQHKNHATS